MANTTSISFPNMFNVTQNKVTVLEDAEAVRNRTRLLMLTEPTELYNNPDFGLGLRKHMWKYNNDNEKAILLDRLKSKLKEYEPYVNYSNTQYSDGLVSDVKDYSDATDYNDMELTVYLDLTFADSTTVSV